MLIEVVSINGGCPPSTMLIALPSCIGMSLSILTNWKSRRQGVIHWPLLFAISFVELISQVLNLNGLIFAGSSLYTVVHSSVTVYIAVLSYFFLNRKLHQGQWIGIMIVMMGLSIVAAGARLDGQDASLGVVLVLLGSGIHSATYICSEYLLVCCDNPISPELLCTLLGGVGTAINLSWQLVYTLPRYQTLVVDEIAAHNGSVSVIVACYLVLTVSSLVHSLCFFNLLGLVGSTSTGVMKCAQSVVIFVLSHFAFCSVQRSQCFTPLKGLSLVVVLLGVVMYAQFQHKSIDGSEHAPYHLTRRNSDTRVSLQLTPYLPVRDRRPSQSSDYGAVDSACSSPGTATAQYQQYAGEDVTYEELLQEKC